MSVWKSGWWMGMYVCMLRSTEAVVEAFGGTTPYQHTVCHVFSFICHPSVDLTIHLLQKLSTKQNHIHAQSMNQSITINQLGIHITEATTIIRTKTNR